MCECSSDERCLYFNMGVGLSVTTHLIDLSSYGETRTITQDYFHEEKFQRSSNSLHIEDIMVYNLDIQKENY